MTGDLTRRIVLARWAGLIASAAVMPLSGVRTGGTRGGGGGDKRPDETNANRAVAACNAMQKYFSLSEGTSLSGETYPWTGGNKYAFLWTPMRTRRR